MNHFFSFDDDEFFGDLLLMGASSGSKAVEAEATGNPLTFLTDLARPLKSLLIPFTPQQEGTGDPSPQNIRPIVPWNGLSVYHSGADTSNPTETDISFPSPVYGGTLDVVSGVLTVTHGVITKNTANMDNNEDYPGWKNTVSREWVGNINGNINGSFSNISPKENGWILANTRNSDPGTLMLNKDKFDKTQSEWIALAIDVQIAIPLATPQEITLTPEQITALVGDNTIWSDADGSMTAVYLKKG